MEYTRLRRNLAGVIRLAPTPSGFLHLGNLVNFELVNRLAQDLSLKLLLRIDDADAGRLREQYTTDIYRVLEFLDIQPDFTSASQLERTAVYWDALKDLAAQGAPLFVCTCSRTQMPNRRCEAGCDRTLAEFSATSGEDRVRLRYETEDVTLWGREHPSYHLVSCVDDRDYGVTHVVRGDDLKPSTQIHKNLNTYLGHNVRFAHHELLLDNQGNKLSKSHGTDQLELTSDLKDAVNATADRLISGVLAQFS